MGKRKFGAKIWIAIVLIIFSCLSSYGRTLEMLANANIEEVYKPTINTIFPLLCGLEFLPFVLAIILIHYDHKYDTRNGGNLSLLCKWTLTLICIEPVFSFLVRINLGILNVYDFLAGYLFIIIAFVLIIIDGRKFVSSMQKQTNDSIDQPDNNSRTEQPSQEQAK